MFVIEWPYLLCAQVLLLVIYYLNRKRFYTFELSGLFQSKVHFLTMNAAVIATCIYMNLQRQLFCIPVAWTSVSLILFCISFLVFPFVNKASKLFFFVLSFAGTGLFIALYILLFGRQEYLIFIALNLPLILLMWFITRALQKYTHQNYYYAFLFYPAFILAPYFIGLQLVFLFRSLLTKTHKIIFVSSSVFILAIGLLLTLQVKRIFEKTATSQALESELRNLNKNPVNNYLIELILGAHWKYHTELCNYDGWRPPFHDPVLVLSNKVLFPFEQFGQGTKIIFYDKILYEKLYPGNAIVFNCRCAVNENLFDF